MKREMRWLFHLGEGNKANVIRLANLFEGPANPHVSREALSLIRRVFKGSDGGRHGKSPAQPWIAWILVRPLLLALLAKGYQLVGAKAPAFDEPHLLMLLRSEEHTSELQSLMRISYAVFCLKKKKNIIKLIYTNYKYRQQTIELTT